MKIQYRHQKFQVYNVLDCKDSWVFAIFLHFLGDFSGKAALS